MAMAFLYSVYILTLALLLYMVFLLVRMSGSKAAAAFLCVVFSEILIILGMMLEVMMGYEVSSALACLKLKYVGQAVFLMSLLYFCSIFLHKHIPAAVYVAQAVVNFIMLAGCLTAEYHTFFYSSMYITYADAPYPTIKVTDGPIWYMHYAHLFIVQFAVIIIALLQYRKGNARQKARSRYLLIGLGIETFELILKGLGLFGSFNPFVIAAFILTVCLYIGIIRYGYFDTVEAAMNNALNLSAEGFLVADNQENVMFLNKQMRQLFPALKVGAPVRNAGTVADIFDGKREIRRGDVYYKAVLEDVREGELCDGKMLRLIDMTEYLMRMEMLRRESELKTDFLSRVSHEIRTPLNTINGMNEMILNESREPQTLAYAKDIHEAEETLMSLIGDVLDVTRIEKSELVLEPEEFSLAKLLRRLWRAAWLKCQKKGLALSFNIDPGLPSVWYADEARTYQVAENLLSNAVKYTETGSVTLTLRRSEKESIKLVVEDTGIGIPKGSEDKIFNRFEQLQTGNRRQGLGLGLEITRNIVMKMGGRIGVTSEVGKGSRFTVKLPMSFAEGAERIGTDWRGTGDTEAKRLTYRCEGRRILVVDDNEMNRKVLRNYLKESGLQIDEAESAEECLELLGHGNPYDLLFLDHMMPGMDGIELFHAITALPAYKENPVPAIALTANAVKGAKQMYLSEGFDDYLAKPVDSQTLYELLLEYLGGELTWVSSEDVDYGGTFATAGRVGTMPGETVMMPDEAVMMPDEAVKASSGEADTIIDDSVRASSVEADIVPDDAAAAPVKAVTISAGSNTAAGEAGGSGDAAAAPVLSAEKLEHLRRLGMDTDTALRYADGSTEFLAEELTLFLKNEPRLSEAMDNAMKNADLKKLSVHVHELKNNLATLGFAELSAEARALEAALRENGDTSGYEEFKLRCRRLADSLRSAVGAL